MSTLEESKPTFLMTPNDIAVQSDVEMATDEEEDVMLLDEEAAIKQQDHDSPMDEDTVVADDEDEQLGDVLEVAEVSGQSEDVEVYDAETTETEAIIDLSAAKESEAPILEEPVEIVEEPIIQVAPTEQPTADVGEVPSSGVAGEISELHADPEFVDEASLVETDTAFEESNAIVEEPVEEVANEPATAEADVTLVPEVFDGSNKEATEAEGDAAVAIEESVEVVDDDSASDESSFIEETGLITTSADDPSTENNRPTDFPHISVIVIREGGSRYLLCPSDHSDDKQLEREAQPILEDFEILPAPIESLFELFRSVFSDLDESEEIVLEIPAFDTSISEVGFVFI